LARSTTPGRRWRSVPNTQTPSVRFSEPSPCRLRVRGPGAEAGRRVP
jgi:hypothetical protein